MAGKFARVVDSVVFETFELPDHNVRVVSGYKKDGTPTFEDRPVTIQDIFPAELNFIPCAEEVEQGFTYDGSSFAAPVPVEPPAPTKWEDKLKSFLASNPDVREGLEG